MKKLFTLFTLALLAIPIAGGTEVTFYASYYNSYSNGATISSLQSQDVTLTFFKGSNSNNNVPVFQTTNNNKVFRIYGGNLFTVAIPTGNYLREIKLTFAQKKDFSFTTDGTNSVGSYSLSNEVGTWTAPDNSTLTTLYVKNTESGQANLTAIAITFDDGSGSTTTVAAPTFSPPAGEVASGSTITINNNETGATVYYTTDQSDPKSSSTKSEYSQPIAITSATTFKAVAYKNGVYSDVATASYTINSGGNPGTGDEFVLVTNASQIAAGNEYVVVNCDRTYAAGTFTSGYFDYVNGFTFAENNTKLTVSNENIRIFTLEESTTNGAYYIKDQDGSYYKFSTSDNTTVSKEKGDVYVTLSNGFGRISGYSGNNPTRWLEYNNTSPRFALYKSNSTTGNQRPVYLYCRAADRPAITPASTTVKGGLLEGVTITYNGSIANADIYYTTDGSAPSATNGTHYQSPFNVTGSGGQAVTVKAVAVNGASQSNIATATYTFQAPSKPTITVPTSLPGDVTINSEDGGVIYYLVNPTTTPQNADDVIAGNQIYSGPITINEEGTYSVYAAVNLNGITSFGQPATFTLAYPTPTLTISPNGGNFSDSQEVTISAEDGTAPYTITYAIDGGAQQTYSAPFTITETSTIVATVTDAHGKTATATATFTKMTAKQYVRINNISDLKVGKHYLIVCENNEGAMGGIRNTNFRSIVTDGITLADGVANTLASCQASIFTLGGASGAYTLYDGTYYLAVTSGTQLNSVTSASATSAKWSITFSGNNATINNNSSNKSIVFDSYESDSYFQFWTGNDQYAKEVQLYMEQSIAEPVITPEGGTFLNSQKPLEVTITCDTEGAVIYYTTDGTDPTVNEQTGAVTHGAAYTEALTINENTEVRAIAVKTDGNEVLVSEVVSAAYRFTDVIVNPVYFSPIPGEYKGAQTLQMYSTTQNAKIYYTMTDDGSEPADPTTNSTLYSNTEVIDLAVEKTYHVKAVAYVGNSCSEVASGTYIINAAATGNYLNSVGELNTANASTTKKTMTNPVQVVYMSTWRHEDGNPEYAYVRDNTGYGLIYFGNGDWSEVSNPKICEMGDWIPGNVIKGPVQVWSDGFHNELGGSSQKVNGWPKNTDVLTNTPIIPEEMTNANINAGWDASKFKNGDYSTGVTDNNVWGHYVHLRKNTIENVGGAGNGTGKHYGDITDQSGVPLNYYDGFYLFSGFNDTPDYNAAYFDNIKNNGGTFDVYAIVAFFGPYATDADHYNTPFEVFPIDFLSIYKPMYNNLSSDVTYYEPQTVSLTCETEGAKIWYKTSDMEDYVEYTGPFTVENTTTIEAYSSIDTKYNDVMESVVNTLTVNIGSIDAPVITQANVVKAVGETTTTDITCATEGATIYYTTDGSDPKTSNTRIEYTLGTTLSFSTTTTVRAIAYKVETVEGNPLGYYSAEAEARTYTFVNNNGVIYDLVTDVNQLNEENVYVVVNKANHMAMSTTQNTNNRGATGVKFVDEATRAQVYGNGEVALFTLQKVGNNWYLHAMNGSGYLCVGDGNTLLTADDADGNAEATIAIDADAEHQAHISYVYNNELTRYLRYYNGGQAFSTYTSETSNLPVSLYYSAATTLGWIEQKGVKNQSYTVADDLQVVWVNTEKSVAWARDLVDNIDAVEIPTDKIDYMQYAGQQKGEWQQNNWVMLDLRGIETSEFVKISNNCVIKGGTLAGEYVDPINYTIKVSGDAVLEIGESIGKYTPNVYCAANYGADKNGIQASGVDGSDKEYWFMTPKVMEVATHTWSVWNDNPAGFFVPAFNDTDFGQVINGAHLKGGYEADLTTYNVVNFTPSQGQAYEFLGVVMLQPEETTTPASAPRRAGSNSHDVEDTNLNADYKVAALNLTGGQGQIVTGVNQLQAGREVVSVTYCDVAGRMSQKPFQGLNIIVTRYTDGTTVTRKALF